jgi:hypothetical protein
VALAVAPAAPTSVHASASSLGVVGVTWSPAASPEPDLVGYQVSRDGQTVYACSTAGAGPGAGEVCPSPLTYEGPSAAGTWTYGVAALRFGSDASATNVVASKAVTTSVQVDPSAVGPGSGTSGPVSVALPPVPIVETAPTVAPVAPPATASATTLAPATTIVPQYNETLPYNGQSAQAQGSAALGSDPKETGPKPNVDSLAALALGLIALALALHVWYLRGEMRLFAARYRAEGSG